MRRGRTGGAVGPALAQSQEALHPSPGDMHTTQGRPITIQPVEIAAAGDKEPVLLGQELQVTDDIR